MSIQELDTGHDIILFSVRNLEIKLLIWRKPSVTVNDADSNSSFLSGSSSKSLQMCNCEQKQAAVLSMDRHARKTKIPGLSKHNCRQNCSKDHLRRGKHN